MNYFKIIGNYLVKSIIAVLLVIMLYLIIAFILTIIPVNTNFKETKKGKEIFISTNGVHTNIILPAKTESFNWNEFLRLNTDCKYIAFGWGDEEFYLNTPTWDDLKISTAFKAGFLPTKTIMQIYCMKNEPYETESTIKISISNKQFNKITNFVKNSFKLDSNKLIIKVKPNNKFYFKEQFYRANGTYSVFNTCNNWTNRALKQAGVKNAVWAPFDKSVMYHLKKTDSLQINFASS